MSSVHHVERLSPHPQHSISLHHRKPLTLRSPVFINIGGRVEYVYIYHLLQTQWHSRWNTRWHTRYKFRLKSELCLACVVSQGKKELVETF